MTLTLIEGAIDALYAYLEANMAGKVTVLNARYADVYVLENIKAWYRGNFPHSLPEHPSIVLEGASWTPRMQKSTDLYGNCVINVVVLYGSDEPEKRFRLLSRYAIGIIELLNAGEASMGYTFKFVAPVTISDTLATPQFLQGVTVPIALEKMESI